MGQITARIWCFWSPPGTSKEDLRDLKRHFTTKNSQKLFKQLKNKFSLISIILSLSEISTNN